VVSNTMAATELTAKVRRNINSLFKFFIITSYKLLGWLSGHDTVQTQPIYNNTASAGKVRVNAGNSVMMIVMG